MLTEKITRTSFITLHLPDGRVFDGAIIADFGGCIQVMPKGCSINFNLSKEKLDVVSIEEGEMLPRYTMNMPTPPAMCAHRDFWIALPHRCLPLTARHLPGCGLD